MELILWLVGMAISLMVFAIKAGCGLGFARASWKEVALVYSGYGVVFVVVSLFAEWLVEGFGWVLRSGAYIHLVVALLFILWAIYGMRSYGGCCKEGRQNMGAMVLLVLPCPVCTLAIAYSVWSAVSFTGYPSSVMGAMLLSLFLAVSTVAFLLARRAQERALLNLSLTLLVVGLYFLLALFVPAAIEKARQMYPSFQSMAAAIGPDWRATFVLAACLVVFGAGLITGRRRG